MKYRILTKIITLSLFTMLLLSCSKDPIIEVFEIGDGQLVVEGDFESAVHPTSGKASVFEKNGKLFLVFTNFKTDSGPDLKVYLSKDRTNDDFVNLDKLKSVSGDFYYEIPANTKIEDYNHVLIWCRAFSVLFGNAELE